MKLPRKPPKEKTCKDCGYNSITGTKRYDFVVLVCACVRTTNPISVAKTMKELNYTVPKWCPRK